eukprot:1158109-Pelagomonas_calceolata.AAC.13
MGGWLVALWRGTHAQGSLVHVGSDNAPQLNLLQSSLQLCFSMFLHSPFRPGLRGTQELP